jgi:hypothetical protein
MIMERRDGTPPHSPASRTCSAVLAMEVAESARPITCWAVNQKKLLRLTRRSLDLQFSSKLLNEPTEARLLPRFDGRLKQAL